MVYACIKPTARTGSGQFSVLREESFIRVNFLIYLQLSFKFAARKDNAKHVFTYELKMEGAKPSSWLFEAPSTTERQKWYQQQQQRSGH